MIGFEPGDAGVPLGIVCMMFSSGLIAVFLAVGQALACAELVARV